MAFDQFLRKTFSSVDYSVPSATKPRWRWYHGAALIVGANVAAFVLEALVAYVAGNASSIKLGSAAQLDYFYELKQASFTPPGWVFGPVWILNNILMVIALIRTANRPKNTPGRSAFVKLQVVSWVIFATFNAFFVGLLSPINAFVLTFAMFVLTVASIFVALKKLHDPTAAWLLSTLLVWTFLASAVALCQALWNYDSFYAIGPFLQAPDWLLRS